MSFVYSQEQGAGISRRAAFDINRCAASVSDGRHWPRYHQCARKPVLREPESSRMADSDVLYGWCKTHAPSAEKARLDATMARERAQIDASPYMRVGVLRQAIDRYLAGEIDRDELKRIRDGGK